MTDINHQLDMTTRLYQTSKKLKETQEQLAQAQLIINQQNIQNDELNQENNFLRQQNKQLQEKVIIQESLNNQLSQIHLSNNISKSQLATKEVELSKAQEHILALGHILLKNKQTIDKLKKTKSKDESLNNQIAELIEEKNFLWDLVLNVHQELTEKPHYEHESKYEKSYEILELIRLQKRKKLKP